MAISGYCVTCNQYFPIEERIAGKILALGATAVFGPASADSLPWWAALALAAGSIWLGHKIDQQLMLRCPNNGCSRVLKIVDAALS